MAFVADVEVSLCHPWSALSENSPRTFIFSNNRGYLYVSIYDVLSFLTSQKDKKKSMTNRHISAAGQTVVGTSPLWATTLIPYSGTSDALSGSPQMSFIASASSPPCP